VAAQKGSDSEGAKAAVKVEEIAKPYLRQRRPAASAAAGGGAGGSSTATTTTTTSSSTTSTSTTSSSTTEETTTNPEEEANDEEEANEEETTTSTEEEANDDEEANEEAALRKAAKKQIAREQQQQQQRDEPEGAGASWGLPGDVPFSVAGLGAVLLGASVSCCCFVLYDAWGSSGTQSDSVGAHSSVTTEIYEHGFGVEQPSLSFATTEGNFMHRPHGIADAQ